MNNYVVCPIRLTERFADAVCAQDCSGECITGLRIAFSYIRKHGFTVNT